MKLSIRKFLLLNLLLALTFTVIIAALGKYFLDKDDIDKNLDSLLTQTGFVFRALVSDAIKNGHSVTSIQNRLDYIPAQMNNYHFDTPPDRPFLSRYLFQVWDKNQHLVLHSVGAPLQPMTLKNGLSDESINGKYWRVLSTQDPQLGLTFAVAEHYGTRELLVRRITKDDIIIMMLVYPLFGLFIWFVVGHELLSIKNVASQVAQRAADHLEPFNLEEVPQEVQPLVDELNKLFLRLKQAFEREQRFAADAAHELRTPLAALKTQAQVALKITDPRERQTQLQNVIAGVDRCTHVIQQLLTLCRMSPETTTLEECTEVDLAKLAAEVIGQLAPLAIDKQIEIELIATDPHCILQGNTTGLHALIRNLVDNAIRYTPENGNIRVFVQDKRDNVILRVIDNGPGIPADLRSRVFERFYRVLGTSVQGSGLGLAIVLQIVKLHKGNVRLGAPENGIGLEVEVELPHLLS
jgi:two-component system, OmpR family, sensor histidine kinase QseC